LASLSRGWDIHLLGENEALSSYGSASSTCLICMDFVATFAQSMRLDSIGRFHARG
jgi:hypothetical protein